MSFLNEIHTFSQKNGLVQNYWHTKYIFMVFTLVTDLVTTTTFCTKSRIQTGKD